ncbi:hypothetical protein DFH08DRAFT_699461, partial [Mycena albidolilacea]
YMALGAHGISVVFASGDVSGVRGRHDVPGVCMNNTFMPVFPASCPWVTSVGSTQSFAPEKAINFTGGGFSNFFPTAYCQTAAVSGFWRQFRETSQAYSTIWQQGLDSFVFPRRNFGRRDRRSEMAH